MDAESLVLLKKVSTVENILIVVSARIGAHGKERVDSSFTDGAQIIVLKPLSLQE